MPATSHLRTPLCSSLCLIIFLQLVRPSRSPLFPYTTLFRSSNSLACRTRRQGSAAERGAVGLAGQTRSPAARGGRGRRRKDRKSTRLNSSHTVISYAVFCLKKKIGYIGEESYNQQENRISND